MSPWVPPPPVLPASLTAKGLVDQIQRMPSRPALLACFICCCKALLCGVQPYAVELPGSGLLWLGKGVDLSDVLAVSEYTMLLL